MQADRHDDRGAVNLEIRQQLAIVTLDRPARNNALSPEMLAGLKDGFAELARQDVRAAVLWGGASRCFCAGFDIQDIDPADRGAKDADLLLPDERLEQALAAVLDAPVPVVAALNGSAYGGGLDLAVSCDFRVAHRGVTLAMTPARLGIVYPLTGYARFVARLGLQTTRRLFLTAAPLDAEHALSLGLVDELVAGQQDVLACALTLAQTLADNAPQAVFGARRALRQIEAQLLPTNPEIQAELYRLKRASYASQDLQEGLAAFRERRKPDFSGR